MTKEEKVARFQKMNQDIRKGQILCAGSSLMEMFPVEKFVKEGLTVSDRQMVYQWKQCLAEGRNLLWG